VLVLDINLPGRSGLDALATLNEMDPAPRTVMLSQFAVDQYGLRALRAGAMGYLN
jgi:DNA-binding NarL/FixJ family response regulator